MACCYIAAFFVGQLVKTCNFLDLDVKIQYNEDFDPTENQKRLFQKGSLPSNGADEGSVTLSLEGLTCAACVSTVTQALETIAGVDEARVSLQTKEAVIVSSEKSLDISQLVGAVEAAGYGAAEGPRSHDQLVDVLQMKEEIAMLRTSFQGLIWYGAALHSILYLSHFASVSQWKGSLGIVGLLNVISVVVAVTSQWQHAYWIHLDSWRLISRASLNMNSLVSASTLIGLSFSVLDLLVSGPLNFASRAVTVSGITLVFVAGRYIDVLARRQASEYLTKLYDSFAVPEYVKLHSSGKVVPSSFLRRGDTIRLEPFTAVPCDSYVVDGQSAVNQSLVTGESLPVEKGVGDFLLAGTRNLNGELCCVVHKERQDSFYSQLVNSVKDSTSTRMTGHNIVGRATRYFPAFVIAIAVVVPSLQILSKQLRAGFYPELLRFVERAMTILVSACPCALGLAVPSAVVAAVDAAQSVGILLTGGASTLQELESVQEVIFDKTGTLTHGVLAVSQVWLHPSWQRQTETFWALACLLEESEAKGHPVGLAVFKRGLEVLGTRWFDHRQRARLHKSTAIPGQGVTGHVNGLSDSEHVVSIGSRPFVKAYGISDFIDFNNSGSGSGTVVYIGIDGVCAGIILLQDSIRSQAGEAIKTLKDSGVQCSMLTGDTEPEAQRVASILGVTVLGARADPTLKLQRLHALQEKGAKVAMVGDGLNDAPSLAAANAGIIMTRESAVATVGGDIMVLNSDINSVPLVFDFARAAMKQIRLNVRWAFLYNLVALTLATGVMEPFGFVLTPSKGALMMSASSIMITVHSLMLKSRLIDGHAKKEKGM